MTDGAAVGISSESSARHSNIGYVEMSNAPTLKKDITDASPVRLIPPRLRR